MPPTSRDCSFVLVAAFVWGSASAVARFSRRWRSPAWPASPVCSSPLKLDIHHPVLDYQALANSLSPAGAETFDWFQGYGPYDWPSSGKQVVRVKATHPEFWKTENLDTFDGSGWAEATNDPTSAAYDMPPATPAPSAAARATWTQTLRVTIGTMQTTDIVASGTAQQPQDIPGEYLRARVLGRGPPIDSSGPGRIPRQGVHAESDTGRARGRPGVLSNCSGLLPADVCLSRAPTASPAR